MEVVNITPHTVKIGEIVLPQHDEIPAIRVNQHEELLFTVRGIPIKLLVYEPPDLSVLPPATPDTIYVVSRLVADIYKDHREDLVFPYSFTRTNSGRILGCRALARFEARN